MTGEPLTLLLVEDDELTRTGLHALLSAQPDLTVVGEAADGAESLPLVERLRPDVVLMDVRMPRMDGIEATRRLRAADDPPKIIVITTFESDDYVYDALRAGADGFLLKRAPVRQIAQAVRLVAAGDTLLFPDAVRGLVRARTIPAGRPRLPVPLTGRETDILRLMASGLSNPQIADHLTVGMETVKTHVSNVLAKLGARNRTQAVIFAYESGIVTPGERALGPP
ncbi:response regulator transcription factor [Streptomyces sp. DSM 44915]|uniref:Response regulator transcription factor n=1 Tax=Streptomyces chisholmiae TaxID=3075540 RepID=A0ABU2JM66_9ACTN|nr:response regulator transcription factor [Streptomyces sp. DSM 44915]MDT0266081.1 response regulator transcription factor [Streptomyces sp. DSM 44915]